MNFLDRKKKLDDDVSRELSKGVLDLISEFQQETGVWITGIEIRTAPLQSSNLKDGGCPPVWAADSVVIGISTVTNLP